MPSAGILLTYCLCRLRRHDGKGEGNRQAQKDFAKRVHALQAVGFIRNAAVGMGRCVSK